jgi:hypothetical protein
LTYKADSTIFLLRKSNVLSLSLKEIVMTGREITKMALDLEKPPRIPVTLFGGGSWMVHSEGETFVGIKEDPDKIADIFIQTFRKFGHDLLFTGSNFLNYPIHFLGCPIEDSSSDSPTLLGTVSKVWTTSGC